MKKFLVKILMLVFLLIILATSFDLAVSTGLRSMNDYRFQRWNEIKNFRINADIIINGNSRALCHYVPYVFDSAFHCKTYNLGFGGHPFNAQYLKFNYYIRYNTIPKVLVQNVDFLTFSDIFIIGHEREQMLPFVFDPYLNKELKNYGFDFFERYLPFVRYFGYQQEIKNGLFEFFAIKHYKNKISFSGFVPETGNWDPAELNKIDTIHFVKDSFTVNLFKKYLKQLKQNNVKVVLVNSPLYYKASDKFIDRLKMNKFINELASENSVPYLDYTNDSICYDSTMFVKAVHLNETGAVKFTKKLTVDLKKLFPYYFIKN